MPTLTIDGKQVTVKDGTSVFEAAFQNGVSIPHFCYHPKLSIAGNCRMCLVDIEKMPKPAISCNTVATEGMVVHTATEKVQALQKNVLEFILINHPIDCPVCDQAGECKLQKYYMEYTLTDSQFRESKVKKPKKVDLGPYVVLDDERCILCSRCVRFCDEITKTGELAIVNRGDRSTLTTFPGKQLDNKYSLNTVDICPVGALTSKPFRFQCRVWFLKSTPSICSGCATGCNIQINHHDGKVYRYLPRENEAVNQCWTCDEGRLSYDFINEGRIFQPMRRVEETLQGAGEAEALQESVAALQRLAPEDAVFIGSAYESNENNAALKRLADALGVKDLQYSSHQVENPYSDDFLIKADKNPNRAGVEKLGFQKFRGGTRLKVVLALEGMGTRDLARLKEEEPMLLILIASNQSPTADYADVILPAATFAEQAGSFTNFQKRVQRFEKALDPQGPIRPAWKWIAKIAAALGKDLALGSEEKLLEENFGMKYADLGTSGKILE
ncbi:MAG TPA: NADH-quinone oxidoreductase subunit G [Deltaproteobacteria bacterium]|nr:NADH-quinone oxidoreductase subunit G [Deltaproteobacteria bacterium]